MLTITFYSYKGGVGRTLALVNVARELAKIGRNVFVLDLDLEAPGLHFKLLDPGDNAADPGDRRFVTGGFVEIASRFLDAADPDPDAIQDLQDHVIPASPRAGATGSIHLLPAGKADAGEYWRRLGHLPWQQLIRDRGQEVLGLFLGLQKKIADLYRPDYLLIDARTGITEVGGVALALLADELVCLMANNDESRWGTREIIRSLPRMERPPGCAPVKVHVVLTRYPRAAADQEREVRDELSHYLREPPPGESAPVIGPILVLHSDPMLEAKEQVLLGAEVKAVPLFRDYLELLSALGMEGLEALKLRSLEQEAQREEAAGNLGQAVKLRREAATLAAEVHGPDSLEAARAQAARARTLRDHGQADLALEAWRLVYQTFQRSTEREFSEWHAVATDFLLFAIGANAADDRRRSLSWLSSLFAMAPTADNAKAHEQSLNHALRLLEDSRARQSAFLVERAKARSYLDRLEEAEDDLRRALKADNPPWAEVDEVRALLASRRIERGELSQAELLLRERKRDLENFYGAEDERTRAVVRQLAALVEGAERPEAATIAAPPIRQSPPAESRLESRRTLSAEPISPPLKLPPPRRRLARGGLEIAELDLTLRVVTPILGGAAVTRTIDEEDVIRVPTIRGHLRFWWRALYGAALAPKVLAEMERGLFGGAADETGGRSTVEVGVEIKSRGEHDPSDVLPYPRGRAPATAGAYALWPARESRGRNPLPAAPRRRPGTTFVLHCRFPRESRAAIENSLRAWILFGGYGGRTRRGAGSLTVEGAAAHWLPEALANEALVRLFNREFLRPEPGRPQGDLPLLAGAEIWAGQPQRNAEEAWETALRWLADFRQGAPQRGPLGAHDSRFARDQGNAQRPGRSNWPEADKVRRLSGSRSWAHPPLHSPTPVWPRAGFGLPIIGQFQQKDRVQQYYSAQRPPTFEPEPFELHWREWNAEEKEYQDRDRLGSPLIVKALPLANGQFAPGALWLYRGYPAGQVALKAGDPRAGRSAAAFDELVAAGDTPRFAPLAVGAKAPAGMRLRTAFFDWLRDRPGVRRVGP